MTINLSTSTLLQLIESLSQEANRISKDAGDLVTVNSALFRENGELLDEVFELRRQQADAAHIKTILATDGPRVERMAKRVEEMMESYKGPDTENIIALVEALTEHFLVATFMLRRITSGEKTADSATPTPPSGGGVAEVGDVDDHGFGDTSELLRMAQRANISFPQARAFLLELVCAPPEQLERMLSRARRMRTAIENTKTRKGIRT